MKSTLKRASLIYALVITGCSAASFEQNTLAYSSKDDLEAARAYAATAGHNQDAANLYKTAADLLRKQQYARALAILDQMTKLDNSCADAYASYAYAQTWLQQYSQAIDSLSKAININNNKPIYFYRKALCMFCTERLDDAIKELNRAIQLKPDDADCLRLRARCYQHTLNGCSNAIADLGKLIEIRAYTVESLCERASIYAKNNECDKAMVDLQKALEMQPDCGEAHVVLGGIFYNRKQYALAEENYTAALVCGTDKAEFCRIQRDVSRRYLKSQARGEASSQGVRDNRPK